MKKYFMILLVGILGIALVACSKSTKGDLEEVKFGLMPYYDYAPWALAEDLGYFEEEGISFKPTLFPVEGNVAPALANGSINIGAFSDTPSITLAAQFEDLQMVAFHNVFKGFAIMTRKDQFKTYDEWLKELGDPKKAAVETGKQLKGKSVVTTSGAAFYMVLEQALKNADLTMDDIKIIDMEPDVGVSAFISGTGDFYLGGLPQRERLQQEGYLALIGGDDIGPGAVILAGIAATKGYVEKHPDTIEKIERVWFKTMEYMKTSPDKAHSFIAEWSNKETGSKTKGDEVAAFLEDYVIFPKSLAEAESLFYDPSSPTYWKDRYDYLISYHEGTKEIEPGKVDIEKLIKAESIFEKLK